MKNEFYPDRIVRKNILNIKGYSSARDEYSNTEEKTVYLDANESPFTSEVNRYPDPRQTKLKSILGEIKQINTEHIFLGNGSDEIFDLIFKAFFDPHLDSVITLPPTYGMFSVLTSIHSIHNIEISLTEDFLPQNDLILKRINSNTKGIIICSPNNPTGNIIPKDMIIEILEHSSILVIVDEAYIDFSRHKSLLSLLKRFSNLIIVQTLSKAYGMAGIRLGVCYASKEIISFLNRIKSPYNISTLSQNYAIKHLENYKKINSDIEIILSEKKKLVSSLKKIKCVEKVFDSDSNFVLVKVDDANLRYEQLKMKGIIVRNRTKERLCKNCIRITVGKKAENELLINSLRAVV